MTLTLTLPYEAVMPDNHRHVVRGGRLYSSRRYKHALATVAMLARTQWRRAPLDGPVALTVRCHFPDRRRRDVVNYGKLLGDALSGVCWHDDAQLDDVRFVRDTLDPVRPRLDLTINPREP